MLRLSASQYGLSHWKSLPEGAIPLFSTFKSLNQKEPDFKGFGSVKNPALIQALIKVLRAAENLLSIQGKDPPSLEDIAPIVRAQQRSPDFENAFGRAAGFIANVLRNSTMPRLRNLFNQSYFAALKGSYHPSSL